MSGLSIEPRKRIRISSAVGIEADKLAEVFFELGALAVTHETQRSSTGDSCRFGEKFVITHIPTGTTVMARVGTFRTLKYAQLAVERLTPLAAWETLKSPTKELGRQVESVLTRAMFEERLHYAKGGA